MNNPTKPEGILDHPYQPPLQHEPSTGASWWNYAWLVVLLLWPVALLNYLDRQLMAAMKTSMMADIPSIATQANWGLLLAVFKWVYACLSPIGGFVADRYSRRRVIIGSLVVWSAVTCLTGLAQSFGQLVWIRALMGISEACYIPAALALIAEYHFGETRSRAVGWHQMAIYIGVILGGFSGYVAEYPAFNGPIMIGSEGGWIYWTLHLAGWRIAFLGAGICGILYAVPLLLTLREPKSFKAIDKNEGTTSNRLFSVIGELLSKPSFLLLILCFTLPALAGWVVRDWMPAILKEQFQLGQGKAGVSATLYVNVAAILGVLLGGYLADRWMGLTSRGRIYTSACGMLMLIPALFGVGNAGTLNVAILFLALFGLGWGFFDCNNMPILCQIARPEIRATGYGIMNFVSISCGGAADYAFGFLRDREVPLNQIFGVFALTALISVICVLCIQPKNYETSSKEVH